MSERLAPLRVAVPDVPAARALADAWRDGPGDVAAVELVPLGRAEAAVRSGAVDLAFVPTLSVLRDPDAFSVVPGVGLVGRAYAGARLHLPAGIGQLQPAATISIGLDPALAQEALLAQVILRELYAVQPQFVPIAAGGLPPQTDAYLLARDAPLPDGGLTLDLGQEWFEMTTRPMVWALLVSISGGIDPEEAARLGDVATELDADQGGDLTEEPTAVSLARYAHAGLEDWVHQLFYHRAIEELVEVPFVPLGELDDNDDDNDDDDDDDGT